MIFFFSFWCFIDSSAKPEPWTTRGLINEELFVQLSKSVTCFFCSKMNSVVQRIKKKNTHKFPTNLKLLFWGGRPRFFTRWIFFYGTLDGMRVRKSNVPEGWYHLGSNRMLLVRGRRDSSSLRTVRGIN